LSYLSFAIHSRSSQLHFIAIALWIGIISSVCGKEILSHVEPAGEKIVLSCPFEGTPSWCFLALDFQAENPGQRPADWRVAVSSRDYRSDTSIRSSFSFRSQPGAATRGSVVVPTGAVSTIHQSGYAAGYIGLEAACAGGGTGTGSLSSRNSSQSEGERTTLISAAARHRVRTAGGSPYGNLFNNSQAPVDWRAYCGFHSIHLMDNEWEAMTPAARTAIKHWIRLGGHLHLWAGTSGKSLEEMGLPKPEPGPTTGVVSRGSLDQHSLSDLELKEGEKAANRDWAMRATSGDAVKEWEQRDASAFATPSAQLAASFMLIVVVGFAILVGPLNVFVFAAARRRHRLFVTTPLISLGAGGLLVMSVILSDGIGGKGVRYVWMESAPAGENTNYLVQHQHSRCGAMFSTGFEIPEDAFFAPMVLETGELAGNLSVNLEPGKVTAAGPWFSSRRSQNFYLAAARPGRGRIEKTGPDERPVLTSAFDFPIDQIFWLAADGKTWWQAGTLAQGTATALQPCTAAQVRKALGDASGLAPPEYARDLTTAAARPGYFVALANRIAAIETHKRIRWQTHGFVTGPVITP